MSAKSAHFESILTQLLTIAIAQFHPSKPVLKSFYLMSHLNLMQARFHCSWKYALNFDALRIVMIMIT